MRKEIRIPEVRTAAAEVLSLTVQFWPACGARVPASGLISSTAKTVPARFFLGRFGLWISVFFWVSSFGIRNGIPLFPARNLVLLSRSGLENRFFMTLDEANKLIRSCAERMNELYGKVVFDEWAMVSLLQHGARILAYDGARKEDFQKNFASDVQDLRAELLSNRHHLGDFEVARHGFGT